MLPFTLLFFTSLLTFIALGSLASPTYKLRSFTSKLFISSSYPIYIKTDSAAALAVCFAIRAFLHLRTTYVVAILPAKKCRCIMASLSTAMYPPLTTGQLAWT